MLRSTCIGVFIEDSQRDKHAHAVSPRDPFYDIEFIFCDFTRCITLFTQIEGRLREAVPMRIPPTPDTPHMIMTIAIIKTIQNSSMPNGPHQTIIQGLRCQFSHTSACAVRYLGMSGTTWQSPIPVFINQPKPGTYQFFY